MNKDFKSIVGKKILGIGDRDIYLEGGICISFHPYETYIETYSSNQISPKNVKYYSPKLFEEQNEN